MKNPNYARKVPRGVERSDKWPSVRAAFLKENPKCVVCGGKVKLEAHHMMPFHLDPSKELDPANLIALCESKRGGVNCHLFVGHLGNFSAYNPKVKEDAPEWADKIKNRAKE